MDIKLVAFDLDGTLLNDEKEILPGSREAILKLQEKGVVAAICTGRIFIDAACIARSISNDMLVVACNGACVGKADSKQLQKAYPLDPENVKKITDICFKHGTSPVYYTQDTQFAGEAFEYNMRVRGIPIVAVDPEKKHIYLPDKESFYKVMEEQKGKIYKVLCSDIDEEKKLRTKQEVREAGLAYVTGANVYGQKNLEMTKIGVDKGSVLLEIGKEMGITAENIMVFGDSDNDIAMFEATGYPIAMEHCTEGIRKRAYAFTGSNNGSGIADALYRYIL